MPPVPVKRESRTSFGIAWFATEAEAIEYARIVGERGDTKNGGFFHGAPCGREPAFDHDGLFAVTEA